MLPISCSMETKACKGEGGRWKKGDRLMCCALSMLWEESARHKGWHQRVFPLLRTDVSLHQKRQDKTHHTKVLGIHSWWVSKAWCSFSISSLGSQPEKIEEVTISWGLRPFYLVQMRPFYLISSSSTTEHSNLPAVYTTQPNPQGWDMARCWR